MVSKNPGALSYFNDHQEIRDFLETQSLMTEHNREKSVQSEKLVKHIISKKPRSGTSLCFTCKSSMAESDMGMDRKQRGNR